MKLETLPTTLKEWRHSGFENETSSPRDVWEPLKSFFLDQGLILWKKSTNSKFRVLPPNNEPRCPDGFSYSTVYNKWDGSYGFDVVVSWSFHAIADH
jgi:hypothetical protein